MTSAREIYQTMFKLRIDAMELGYPELAIAYGWSAIRAGKQVIAEAEGQAKSE